MFGRKKLYVQGAYVHTYTYSTYRSSYTWTWPSFGLRISPAADRPIYLCNGSKQASKLAPTLVGLASRCSRASAESKTRIWKCMMHISSSRKASLNTDSLSRICFFLGFDAGNTASSTPRYFSFLWRTRTEGQEEQVVSRETVHVRTVPKFICVRIICKRPC